MNVYGIIMEINPFHNGHVHFIDEVKKIMKQDDLLICIVSGNFVQRGDVSLINKKNKVDILLNNGIDIVVELPFLYTNQGSDYFAYHAIKILNDFKVDNIIFGSEINDQEKLKDLSSKLTQSKNFKKGINEKLMMLKSNDILGISYLKAIKLINEKIEFTTIKRENHNILIKSATDIRTKLSKNLDIYNYVPENIPLLLNKIDYVLMKNIFLLEFKKVCQTDTNIFLSENKELNFMMEKKVKLIKQYNYHEIINLFSNKNNSRFKIQRLILNIILGINNEIILTENYNRVLGFNEKGQKYLKNSDINYHTKLSTEFTVGMIEQRANVLYSIITGDEDHELFKPIIK